jgi:hypothetical protein
LFLTAIRPPFLTRSQFRVRERAEANMRAALMDSWRTLLEQVVGEVKRRENSKAPGGANDADASAAQ